ncbi:MAG: segregation and condensation protein A [Solirubrobacterales bacterium]
MSYTIHLDVFDGPMDLLLKLIDENEVDIYDIPIARITDQYLDYLSAMAELDLDLMADFLVMAATLIRIKSRLLAPRRRFDPEEEGEEIEEDPREELVRRLVEYRQFKTAAQTLMKLQEGETPRVYFREDEIQDAEIELKANLNQLVKAFRTIWDKKSEEDRVYTIPTGDVDVGELMVLILEQLADSPDGIGLVDLFEQSATRRECLGCFLALLELIRLAQVRAVQSGPFAPIQIYLRQDDSHAG